MRYAHIALLVLLQAGSGLAFAQAKPNNTPAKLKGDVLAGQVKSDDSRCQECHGADGNGQGQAAGAAGKFAKLAGQDADYIAKQLRDFRTGKRKYDLMQIMAKSIDEQDSADIAAYFASKPKMQGNKASEQSLGKNLFISGDSSRNILPCSSCHGIDGKGLAPNPQAIPVIGGQDPAYLEKQLRDWRSKERHNSEGDTMNLIASQLTDNEIEALRDYIAGL